MKRDPVGFPADMHLHQLPPGPAECNDPAQHEHYPNTHWASSRCPVHGKDRDRAPSRDSARHDQWYTARERYATGKTNDLAYVLCYVTTDNPPPYIPPRRRNTLHPYLFYGLFTLAAFAVIFVASVLS